MWRQPAHLVADTYVSAVQRAGGLAVLLAVDAHPAEQLLELVDGLVLIGGADVDPATYHAERSPVTEAIYPERDRFELALVHAAVGRELPVLGICRGMQMINVAFGGTLHQDISPSTHRLKLGSFEGTEQQIELAPGSLARRATGEAVHVARCHHHQAVAELGKGLRVTGRARSDGLPEALEAADARWLLGVQWHPEVDEGSGVITALIDEAGRRGRARPHGGNKDQARSHCGRVTTGARTPMERTAL